MPKHVLHFYIGFYRVFFYIVPPDFQYHNEKTSSQWESILHWQFLEKVAVVGCNLCFTLVLKIVRKKNTLYE